MCSVVEAKPSQFKRRSAPGHIQQPTEPIPRPLRAVQQVFGLPQALLSGIGLCIDSGKRVREHSLLQYRVLAQPVANAFPVPPLEGNGTVCVQPRLKPCVQPLDRGLFARRLQGTRDDSACV